MTQPSTSQMFCPKCGRAQAPRADCRGCKIVFARFYQQLARRAEPPRRLFCIACGELQLVASRCDQCGVRPHERYNLIAAEAGLPEAVIDPDWTVAFSVPKEPLGVGRHVLRWGAALLLVALFGLLLIVQLVKSSDACRTAQRFVLESPIVWEALGPELQPDRFPIGSFVMEVTEGTGRAMFRLDVTGGGGEGEAIVGLTREQGRWEVVQAVLVQERGRPLDLLPDPTEDE